MAVLIFPGAESTDFTGPWEVFGAAEMNGYSFAENDSFITTSVKLKVKPDYTFENVTLPDILLTPVGNADPSDITILNWIKKVNQVYEYTMTVCMEAFFLASAGLTSGIDASFHVVSFYLGKAQKKYLRMK